MGLTFKRDTDGLPFFRSPFAPVAGYPVDQYIPLHDPQFTNVMWQVGRGAVMAAFAPSFTQLATGAITQQLVAGGMPADQAQAQAAASAQALLPALDALIPSVLPGLQNSAMVLNLESSSFDPLTNLEASVADIDRIEPTITETYEVGYKGTVENKLIISADLYRTKTRDFVGPLRVETPNVFLEATSLSTSFSQALAVAMQDPAAAQLTAILGALDMAQFGGNGNGTAIDELTTLFVAGTASNGPAYIPFGTISSEQATDPAAVMLAYRNFGEVKIYGMDLAFGYYPDDIWAVTGSYSYVNKDIFRDLDGIGDIALNAPSHKIKFGLGCNLAEMGLRLAGQLRYRSSFPMSSGVFVGPVEPRTALDLNAAYDLPLSMPNATVTLTANATNVLNKKVQDFIGAPATGRLVYGGVAIRF